MAAITSLASSFSVLHTSSSKQTLQSAQNLSSLGLSFHFSLRPSLSSNFSSTLHPLKVTRTLGELGEEIDRSDAMLGEEDGEIEEEDEEEEESSIELLVRFLQNVLRKLSKRSKKATRSILPAAISPQLVSFAVDGVLLLTLLSTAKALLEVVCTLGGTVFAVILLLRLIWAAASHFQTRGNILNQSGTQPAT